MMPEQDDAAPAWDPFMSALERALHEAAFRSAMHACRAEPLAHQARALDEGYVRLRCRPLTVVCCPCRSSMADEGSPSALYMRHRQVMLPCT